MFCSKWINTKTSNSISYGRSDGQILDIPEQCVSALSVKSRGHFAEVSGRWRHYSWLLLVSAVGSLMCCCAHPPSSYLCSREAPHLGRVQLEEQPGKLGGGGGVGRKMTPKWCSSSSRSFGQS